MQIRAMERYRMSVDYRKPARASSIRMGDSPVVVANKCRKSRSSDGIGAMS